METNFIAIRPALPGSEFTPSAKLTLGTWNTRFDDDYARWLTMQAAGRARRYELGLVM